MPSGIYSSGQEDEGWILPTPHTWVKLQLEFLLHKYKQLLPVFCINFSRAFYPFTIVEAANSSMTDSDSITDFTTQPGAFNK